MYKELISELTRENKWVRIQPPCSESDIKSAEKEVGYTFPNELRALLLEMNGDRFLLLSTEEIVEQSRLNRKIQEEYSDEEFAKELDRFIFFAGNGCGDYFCYHADSNGVIDDSAICIWEHEEFSWRRAASNMIELITKYYRDEL